MNEAVEPKGVGCIVLCLAGCLVCVADSVIAVADVITGGTAFSANSAI